MPHTRPTTDIAKEGLFNILQNRIDFEGLKTLDLFGGTGSISYELASRGASDLTVVEKDGPMFQFIKKTVTDLKIENCRVINTDVFKFIEESTESFDFVFAGPPYALTRIDELPVKLFQKPILNADGWFVLEHTPCNDYATFPFFKMARNYGTTIFSFFVNTPTAATE